MHFLNLRFTTNITILPPLGKLSQWPWLLHPPTPHFTSAAHLLHPSPRRARLWGVHWHRTGWRLVANTLSRARLALMEAPIWAPWWPLFFLPVDFFLFSCFRLGLGLVCVLSCRCFGRFCFHLGGLLRLSSVTISLRLAFATSVPETPRPCVFPLASCIGTLPREQTSSASSMATSTAGLPRSALSVSGHSTLTLVTWSRRGDRAPESLSRCWARGTVAAETAVTSLESEMEPPSACLWVWGATAASSGVTGLITEKDECGPSCLTGRSSPLCAGEAIVRVTIEIVEDKSSIKTKRSETWASSDSSTTGRASCCGESGTRAVGGDSRDRLPLSRFRMLTSICDKTYRCENLSVYLVFGC